MNVEVQKTLKSTLIYKYKHLLSIFQEIEIDIRPVVPGCAGCAQILADQLTLYQPGGTDYACHITTY